MKVVDAFRIPKYRKGATSVIKCNLVNSFNQTPRKVQNGREKIAKDRNGLKELSTNSA